MSFKLSVEKRAKGTNRKFQTSNQHHRCKTIPPFTFYDGQRDVDVSEIDRHLTGINETL